VPHGIEVELDIGPEHQADAQHHDQDVKPLHGFSSLSVARESPGRGRWINVVYRRTWKYLASGLEAGAFATRLQGTEDKFHAVIEAKRRGVQHHVVVAQVGRVGAIVTYGNPHSRGIMSLLAPGRGREINLFVLSSLGEPSLAWSVQEDVQHPWYIAEDVRRRPADDYTSGADKLAHLLVANLESATAGRCTGQLTQRNARPALPAIRARQTTDERQQLLRLERSDTVKYPLAHCSGVR
jgi:hypothetical protein